MIKKRLTALTQGYSTLNATANYRSGDDTEPYDEETWDLILVYLEGVAEADKKNSGNQQSKKKDVQEAKEKRERAAEEAMAAEGNRRPASLVSSVVIVNNDASADLNAIAKRCSCSYDATLKVKAN